MDVSNGNIHTVHTYLCTVLVYLGHQPKRPRTSSTHTDRPRQSHSHRPTNVRTDSAEDGELRDDPSQPAATIPALAFAPMRRPRRGLDQSPHDVGLDPVA